MSSVPNILTILRLLAVPLIIVFMVDERFVAAFWLFVAAGISDAVDGFIAKKFNAETVLGAYLDPIADKALLMSIFVTLGLQEHIAGWLVILIVSRDVLIIGAIVLSFVLGHRLSISPLIVSKLNTTAQIILAALVLADLSLGSPVGMHMLLLVMIWIVATTTVLSGFGYLVRWLRVVATWEDGGV